MSVVRGLLSPVVDGPMFEGWLDPGGSCTVWRMGKKRRRCRDGDKGRNGESPEGDWSFLPHGSLVDDVEWLVDQSVLAGLFFYGLVEFLGFVHRQLGPSMLMMME